MKLANKLNTTFFFAFIVVYKNETKSLFSISYVQLKCNKKINVKLI